MYLWACGFAEWAATGQGWHEVCFLFNEACMREQGCQRSSSLHAACCGPWWFVPLWVGAWVGGCSKSPYSFD